jgi:predicted lysophospholipase L1 biosynthesis ABC-type transport system permease subunit
MFADFLDFRWVPEWMTSWYFMGPMIVVLIGLIGVLLVLRNRRAEDDD